MMSPTLLPAFATAFNAERAQDRLRQDDPGQPGPGQLGAAGRAADRAGRARRRARPAGARSRARHPLGRPLAQPGQPGHRQDGRRPDRDAGPRDRLGRHRDLPRDGRVPRLAGQGDRLRRADRAEAEPEGLGLLPDRQGRVGAGGAPAVLRPGQLVDGPLGALRALRAGGRQADRPAHARRRRRPEGRRVRQALPGRGRPLRAGHAGAPVEDVPGPALRQRLHRRGEHARPALPGQAAGHGRRARPSRSRSAGRWSSSTRRRAPTPTTTRPG